MKRYVLCLTAANRTGILAAVTTALSELGGDIDELSQAVVKDYFAIILTADFPEHRDPHVIVAHLEGVGRSFGIKVILRDPEREAVAEERVGPTEKYGLTIAGRDAPGIVATVSGRLAREGIDITDMHGSRRDDGQSFALVLELAVPPGVDLPGLQAELDRLGASLGLSARLTRAAAPTTTTDA